MIFSILHQGATKSMVGSWGDFFFAQLQPGGVTLHREFNGCVDPKSGWKIEIYRGQEFNCADVMDVLLFLTLLYAYMPSYL